MRIIPESVDQRTVPFFFHHAELGGKTVKATPDYYGRRLDKEYEVINIYVDDERSPYYMWTQSGNGRDLLSSLERKYKGKWVTAKIKWEGNLRDRISSVGLKIVDPPTNEDPFAELEVEPGDELRKEPEQLELELYES